MRSFAKIVAGLAAAFYLVFGIWAFFAPRSFGENIATFAPYNEHLIHDLGAFQIGIGVAALAGLLTANALAAVLAGVAAGSIIHGISHMIDHGLGGRAIDPWATGLIGLVTLAAAIAAVAAGRVKRPG
jgi:hypothetical protein